MRSPALPVRPASVPALIILGATIAFATIACGTSGGTVSLPASPPAGSPNPTPTPVIESNPRVKLVIANDWDVTAVIADRTGSLVTAASGTGGNTMTVRWFDAQVVNAGPDSLQVTWVGLPRNEEITVEIDRTADGLTLNVLQASPPLNSDVEGSDRVLVLTFDRPVPADAVKVTFEATNAA